MPRSAATDLALVLVATGSVLAVGHATQVFALGPAAVVTGCCIALWRIRQTGQTLSEVGLRPARVPRTLIVGAAVAVGTTIVVGPIGWWLQAAGLAPDTSTFRAIEGDTGRLVGYLMLSWTVAAVGEEFLFRGFLMQRLDVFLGGGRRGRWAALGLQAVLFGVAHLYQGVGGIVQTGAIGLALGTALLWTRRNLWTVILAHGLIDTLGFVALYLGAAPNT